MKSNDAYRIHLFKEQQDIYCPSNSNILSATLAAGFNHTHACGGRAKCSTCRVSILEGIENCIPRNKAEQKITDRLNFPGEIRLACQTNIKGNITIRRMVTDKLDLDLILKQFSKDSNAALGTQQKLTIVFTDIINYTSLAEKFPPFDIVHILNRYYRIMNLIIQDYGGYISDVAGDGILSVFGKDKKSDNSVLDAIHAINEMNRKLKIFNKYLSENFNIQFGIRAGIHYGDVILGPFDTGDMKKLAVIGDNVNCASRIESANKLFGTSLLLSEVAYREVKSTFPNHNSFRTTLNGKSGYYNLFEIVQYPRDVKKGIA